MVPMGGEDKEIGRMLLQISENPRHRVTIPRDDLFHGDAEIGDRGAGTAGR